MDSDCDPSEDSLNLHDLSGLDVELSSDSEYGSFPTPPVSTKGNEFFLPRCIDRTSTFPQSLDALRKNVSQSLSMDNANELDVAPSSDASLCLLSDGKLEQNTDDNIIEMNLDNQTDALIQSPSSDKENMSRGAQNFYMKNSSANDTLKLLGSVIETPVNKRSRQVATPTSSTSLKKVSFSENVLENSFHSSANNSSDDRISLTGVCGVPNRSLDSKNSELVESFSGLADSYDADNSFEADVERQQVTGEDVLTTVTTRMNSSSTLKTDSNTSKVGADISKLNEMPTFISTEKSAVFNTSNINSETLSENTCSKTPKADASVGKVDSGGGDRKVLPQSNSNTLSKSNDTFYKSFSVSESRIQNETANNQITGATFVTPNSNLFADKFDRDVQSDFSNVEISQNASIGDQIFRGGTSVGITSPVIKLHDSEQQCDKIDIVEHESMAGSVDPDSSLTTLGESCESLATSCASDESDHVISLETIKNTWPTLSSYMKAKEIAERFEQLCSQPNDSMPLEKRSNTQEKMTENFLEQKLDTPIRPAQQSIDASGIVDLSEYPLCEDSVFVPNTTANVAEVPTNHVNFAHTASLTNLSCISFVEGGMSSKSRGFSFSTPKVKSPQGNNSTNELLNDFVSAQKSGARENQAGVEDNSGLQSMYLKRVDSSGDNLDEEDENETTVIHSSSLPTVYDDNQSGPKIVDDFAKTQPTRTLLEKTSKISPVSLRESEVAIDESVVFPDTIVNLTSSKEVGIENMSDKWIIANFSVSNCRLITEDNNETVVTQDVFSVKPSIVLSPQSNKVFEVMFFPFKPGTFFARIKVTLCGTINTAKLEKYVKVEGKCESYSARFLRDNQSLSKLELVQDVENSSASQTTELQIEWCSSVSSRLSCNLFCSIPEALAFVSVDNEPIRKCNRVTFFTETVANGNGRSLNTLGLELSVFDLATSVSSITGKLELHAISLSKRLTIAELPIQIKINRKMLYVPEGSTRELMLKCDNDYAPLEFPVVSQSSEEVLVEIDFGKSVVDVSPNSFSLRPAFRQKVRVKVKHGSFPLSGQKGSPLETQLTLFSNGEKQLALNVQVETPTVTCRRALLFGNRAKCMLFRSPEIFSPVSETLKVENTTNEVLDINVYIDKISCFEIASLGDAALPQSNSAGVHLMQMKPKSNTKIVLKFHSFDVRLETACLVLRIRKSLLKFVIPLYGYSGKSALIASSNRNLCNPDSRIREILLRNNGIQDLCFVINPESLKTCSANPMKGIVKGHSEVSVKVLVENSCHSSADVEINWGDYILKKVYDNCLKSSWPDIPESIARLVDENFDKEDSNVSTGVSNIPLSNRFLKFLDNSCFVPLDFDVLHAGDDELPESERTTTSTSTVVHDQVASGYDENERWIVRPDYLVFKSEPQSFVLENRSNECLEFVVLTSDVVVASPVRGVLKSFEQVIIDVRTRKEVSKHKLTRESLCVKIENEVKEVSLDFVHDRLSNSDHESCSGASGVTLSISDEIVTLVNEVLKFPVGTKVGDCQQLTLSFTNNMPDNVKWVLSSLAPCFVKWNNTDVYKANYAAFRVEKSLGYLKEKESVAITVSFVPMDTGSYFQHWELQITSLHRSVSKFIRVCFCGDVRRSRKSLSSVPDLDETEVPGGIQSKNERLELVGGTSETSQRGNLAAKSKRSIVPGQLSLKFPDVKIGSREKMLLSVKNCDKKLHTVQFLSPEPPFFVDNVSCTISAGHFVRLPVSVRVSRSAKVTPPGQYCSILVIKSLSDNISIPVQLQVRVVE